MNSSYAYVWNYLGLALQILAGLGLAAGMVDNKVCAVTEVWSGLRFVMRLADRPSAAAVEGSRRGRVEGGTEEGP